ncbi:hydantoinase/oxoprolinase family protein, partial [Bosea sp. TAB14]|uniref:hydantoinase/oxoprolinase family protein n=1 Tax=Bosea sp. TAB14 TaxID=3237481 RepID=UPI003F8FC525
ACYGKGGMKLTVTDANLLLGRLDGASFMGGAMPLDRQAAQKAAQEIASRLNLSVDQVAAGVIDVANSALATATRLSLFEKGMDPEDFALLSFGGAGGVHACEVAEELGIRRVIFPAHASTLSAWGILWSDIAHDLSATQIGLFADLAPGLGEKAKRLVAEARQLLTEDGVMEAAQSFEWAVDLRYSGQAFDLRVALDDADFAPAGVAKATAGFHALHRQRFSYDEPEVPVEIVALRLKAVGRLAKPVPAQGIETKVDDTAPTRRVHGRHGAVATPVRKRDAIGRTAPVAGPAIVEEPYTSIYLPAGWTILTHASGALIADRADSH